MHDLFKAIVDDFAALPAKIAAAEAKANQTAVSKHTRGPWISVECKSFNCEIEITTQARVDLGMTSICDLDIDFEGEFGVEQQANAKLIVAAPEMLTALRASKSALTHSRPDDCWATGPATGDHIEDLVVCPGCRAMAAIDAAIDKATA